MKRLHVAIFATPQFPCVNPTLAIVNVLIRRGHHVTYVTSDRFASRVKDLHATVVRCPDFPNRFSNSGGKQWNYQRPTFDTDFTDLASETFALTRPFFEQHRPDVILYDLVSLAGRAMAHVLGVPAVQISPAFFLERERLNEQLLRPEFRQATLDDARLFDDFLSQYGLKGDVCFHREKLNIPFYPVEFQLPGTSTDSRIFYAGRCSAEQPYSRSWIPPVPSKRSVALVSTSTYFVQGPDYYRICAEILADMQWHVILAIGSNNDRKSFEPLPPNVEIVQNVPQIQILPHVDLLICLGGMITTMEAVYHGIPMLMMTHGYPEPELYADNNVRLGTGIHLRHAEATPDNIRRSVQQITTDSRVREQVAHLQRVVQNSPGAEEAVSRITTYVRDEA